jgi:hypothetical protein
MQYVLMSLSPEQSDRGVKLITHLHLLLRLRKNGAIISTPPYVSLEQFLSKQVKNFT